PWPHWFWTFRERSAVVNALSLLSMLSLAQAQEPPEEAPPASGDTGGRAQAVQEQVESEGVSLVFRGLGESWDDPYLEVCYKAQMLMGGVGILVPLHPRLMLDLEVGYSRQSGTSWLLESNKPGPDVTVFQMIPVSIVGEFRQPIPSGELFFGAGPSFATFQEDHPSFIDANDVQRSQTSGVKVGGELRLGLRLKTRYQPQVLLPPAPQPLVQGIALEIYAGRRLQRATTGFDLGANRVSVGIQVMF
ncbi:MAG: hypothetical protein ACI9VR_001233, partial [Cognaticolwellia sp.]